MCPVHGTCTVCPPAQTALNPQMRVMLCAVMCTLHPHCAAHCNPPSAAPCALCRTLHWPQHCLALHPAPCTGHGTKHSTLDCTRLYYTAIGVGDVRVAVAITPHPQGGGYRGWGHAAPSSPMVHVGLPSPTGVVQAWWGCAGTGKATCFPLCFAEEMATGAFCAAGGVCGYPCSTPGVTRC